MFLTLQGGLKTLLDYIKEKDPDRVSVALASSLDSIAQLELLQVLFNTIKFKICAMSGFFFVPD